MRPRTGDYVDGTARSQLGWVEVQDASKLANEEGFGYLWDRYVLHRQIVKRRALRGKQLHVCVVP